MKEGLERVLEIEIEDVMVTEADLQKLNFNEVYLYIGSTNSILIADAWNSEFKIEGRALATSWREFNETELREIVRNLIKTLCETRADELRLSLKIREIRQIVEEQLRRAKLKAEVNSRHQRRQGPTISVLESRLNIDRDKKA